MYICVHVYIHIYIYIYVFIYVCIYVSINVYVHIYIALHTPLADSPYFRYTHKNTSHSERCFALFVCFVSGKEGIFFWVEWRKGLWKRFGYVCKCK